MGAILRLLVQFIGRLLARGAAPAVRMTRFGTIAFRGLIGNRLLTSLTQQEVRNALAQVGLREAHNAHFVSRLIERGPTFGITTLNQFARAFNLATARASAQAGAIELVLSGGRVAVVVNRLGELVTLVPL